MGDDRWTIRPYTDDDLSGVLDAWFLASLQAHPFLSDDFFEAERTQIAKQFLPASETWVCEVDGRVVGSVSLVGNEVGGIFVEPASQNRGIGRALLDQVATDRSYIQLEVFAANTIGRRFYDAYGFRTLSEGFDEATGHPVLRLRFGGPES